jgi:general secretion pathway protein C
VATVAELLRINGGLGSQLISRAPHLVVVILVVLIGVRGALFLVSLAGPPAAPPAPDAAPIQVPTRAVVDVASILRANLFGQSASVLDTRNAPVTSMPLTLGGVVAAWDSKGRLDPKGGFALIGTSATDVRNYRVGGILSGGARLHEVHQDRVLLDRGGSIEALMLPPRVGLPAPPPLPPVTGGAVPVQRVQQVMRENPGILNQIMIRSAVLANGKLQGLRVNPGPNRQAFDKLGLRPADLVTAINGTPLSDQTRAEEVFNSLSSAAEANITVERNGTRQELHLNLAEIANEAERLAQGTANPGLGQPPGPDSAR